MDNIISAVVSMLQAGIPSIPVIYGPTPQEPTEYLPLISVVPVTTELEPRGTGGLRTQITTFTITAYVALVDYFDEENDLTVDSMQALVQMMEERNSDNNPDSTTILGVVNNDTTLGGTVDNISSFSVTYDTIPTSRYATATLTVETQTLIPDNC